MSAGFRRPLTHMPSTYISPKHLAAPEDMTGVKVDTSHDVPYCYGLSEDGKTLYVDKDLDLGDRLKPILVHEIIEHALCNAGLSQKEACAIATAAESQCLQNEGTSLTDYNDACDNDKMQVQTRQQFNNIPDDLASPDIDDDEDEEDENDDPMPLRILRV